MTDSKDVPAISAGQLLGSLASLLILFCHFGFSQEKPQSTVSAVKNPDGILFSENNQPVLQYQATIKQHRDGTFARANYIHPLHDLRGTVLTEDFPADHLHQRGIFWAWHRVQVGDRMAGDSWLTDQFQWIVSQTETESLNSGAARLTTHVQWRSPAITDKLGDLLTIVKETTSITVHPTLNRCRAIDFEISLLAAMPNVTIAGSDDEKGYGGFSVRILQPPDIEFLTSRGNVEPIREAADFGNWVDIRGTFGEPKTQSGVAIFVHPRSDGYPQKWILRSEIKSMQNPVYPGRDPVSLSLTAPTVLRYRILLHQDLLSLNELEKLATAYASLEYPKSSAEKSVEKSPSNPAAGTDK